MEKEQKAQTEPIYSEDERRLEKARQELSQVISDIKSKSKELEKVKDDVKNVKDIFIKDYNGHIRDLDRDKASNKAVEEEVLSKLRAVSKAEADINKEKEDIAILRSELSGKVAKEKQEVQGILADIEAKSKRLDEKIAENQRLVSQAIEYKKSYEKDIETAQGIYLEASAIKKEVDVKEAEFYRIKSDIEKEKKAIVDREVQVASMLKNNELKIQELTALKDGYSAAALELINKGKEVEEGKAFISTEKKRLSAIESAQKNRASELSEIERMQKIQLRAIEVATKRLEDIRIQEGR